MLCQHCNADERPVLVRVGPHIMATCAVCKKYVKFILQIADEDFVMPFGKHRGEKLKDIDRGYLQSVLDNVKISARVKRLISDRLKK